MLWWVLMLLVLVILSYLTQLAIYFEMQIRYPYIVSAVINVLILACIVGVVVRILRRMRKKEKETLVLKVKDLEDKLKAKKEENSSQT
jgi:large-conductance mechanosensitive channel